MYALVHKKRVIAGPKDWNRSFFSYALKRENIDFSVIPSDPTQTLPYIIDDQTKIIPVTIEKDSVNPFIQYLRGPLWDLKEDSCIAKYEAVDNSLEAAKQNYKDLLASQRYLKEISSTQVVIQDVTVTIATTREARNTFIQKYTIMGNDDTINWKFPEGWLVLTKTDVQSVISALESHVQSTFDWEKEITDQINNEVDLQSLVKYETIINPPIELED